MKRSVLFLGAVLAVWVIAPVAFASHRFGLQRVSFHGLSVAVPVRWHHRTSAGTPSSARYWQGGDSITLTDTPAADTLPFPIAKNVHHPYLYHRVTATKTTLTVTRALIDVRGSLLSLTVSAAARQGRLVAQVLGSWRHPRVLPVAAAVSDLRRSGGALAASASAWIGHRDGWYLAAAPATSSSQMLYAFHSTDGGRTWRVETERALGTSMPTLSRGGGSIAVRFVSSEQGYVIEVNRLWPRLWILRTINGGRVWHRRVLALPRGGIRAALPFSSPRSGTIGVLIGSGHWVRYQTGDGGETWHRDGTRKDGTRRR